MLSSTNAVCACLCCPCCPCCPYSPCRDMLQTNHSVCYICIAASFALIARRTQLRRSLPNSTCCVGISSMYSLCLARPIQGTHVMPWQFTLRGTMVAARYLIAIFRLKVTKR